MKGIAKEFGYPTDWRKPRSFPQRGVLQRPHFEGLGPRWFQPFEHHDWTLRSVDGSKVSLADYKGRPVLIILYLGFGCRS